MEPKKLGDWLSAAVAKYKDRSKEEQEAGAKLIAAKFGNEDAVRFRAELGLPPAQVINLRSIAAALGEKVKSNAETGKPTQLLRRPKAPAEQTAKANEPEALAKQSAEPEVPIEPEIVTEPSRALTVIPPQAEGEEVPDMAAGDEMVEALNRKYAVVANYGGKTMIVSWEPWPLNRKVLVPTIQSVGDFRTLYMNKYVEVQTEKGIKYQPAGQHWLGSRKRRTYSGVAMEPGEGEELEGRYLNLWRGFAVQPAPGTWDGMRQHILWVLGDGDAKAGEYIIRWLAWTVQNPGKPAEAVLVFQGGEGTGKGTLGRAMLKIFGPYGLPVTDPKHLVGGFSGHLHYCAFMFLDEAFWSGNKAAEGRLKGLVTEEFITIEVKNVTPFQTRNQLHILMASNNEWVVPAGGDARRYAVFKVSGRRAGDRRYFDELHSEINSGGVEAMLYDLLRLDLGDWHPRQIYQTAALQEQKAHSLRNLEAWVEDLLQKGVMPEPWMPNYPNRCQTRHLVASARAFDKFTTDSLVAKKLQELFGAYSVSDGSARGWALPSLSDCRRMFEERNGGQWKWHHEVQEWGAGAQTKPMTFRKFDPPPSPTPKVLGIRRI